MSIWHLENVSWVWIHSPPSCIRLGYSSIHERPHAYETVIGGRRLSTSYMLARIIVVETRNDHVGYRCGYNSYPRRYCRSTTSIWRDSPMLYSNKIIFNLPSLYWWNLWFQSIPGTFAPLAYAKSSYEGAFPINARESSCPWGKVYVYHSFPSFYPVSV